MWDTPPGVVRDTPPGAVRDTPHRVVRDTPPGAVRDTPPGAVRDMAPGAVRGSLLGRAEDPEDIVLGTELVRGMSLKTFEGDTAVDSEVSCLEQHHLALGSL